MPRIRITKEAHGALLREGAADEHDLAQTIFDGEDVYIMLRRETIYRLQAVMHEGETYSDIIIRLSNRGPLQ